MADYQETIELWIEVTSRCSYNCFFCYNHFHTIADKSDGSEITIADLNFILTTIQENYFISIICLSGGEPLLRKDISELVKISARYCNNIIIATNGYEIYKTDIKKIIKSGCKYFQIPLLSSSPELHDSISGVNSSFEKMMNGLLILKKHKIETTIIFIWNHNNSEELKEILNILFLIGVKTLIVNEIRNNPSVLSTHKSEEILIKKRDFILMLKSIDKYAKKLDIKIYVPTYMPSSIIKNLKFEKTEFIYNKTEIKRLIIDSKGNLKRCVASTSSLGSIYSEDFKVEMNNALNIITYICPCKIEEDALISEKL